MTKTIKLTKGENTIVDKDDFEWLSQWKWFCNAQGYATRHQYLAGDKKDNRKRLNIKMHNLIINTPDGMEADHINGNTLDNRRSNLRICTRGQNQRNRRGNLNGTSKYKGVSFKNENKKWVAQIGFKKNMFIGYYKTEIEAALAYNEAAKKYHGKFARLNKI